MQGSMNEKSKTYTISLSKNFDFEEHQEFRQCLKEAFDQDARLLIVDFNVVEYMDSSALGMLMLARHEGEKENCAIELHNVHSFSEKVLRTVEFDKLFAFKTKK